MVIYFCVKYAKLWVSVVIIWNGMVQKNKSLKMEW